MKTFTSIIFLTIISFSYAQTPLKDTTASDPPLYRISPAVDLSITVGGGITNYIGLRVLRNKKSLDTSYVLSLTPEDVNLAINRGAARQDPDIYDDAQLKSDISLVATCMIPSVLAFDKKIREEKWRVLLVYLETQAVVANIYFLSMGITRRNRPYVFNDEAPLARRVDRGATNSIYAGHVAQAAAGSFYAAKVFSDFHPQMKFKGLLYTAAAIPPAVVGYYRYKAGKHFPTDIAGGIVIGAGVAILVPELHKKIRDVDFLSVTPYFNGNAKGISASIKF